MNKVQTIGDTYKFEVRIKEDGETEVFIDERVRELEIFDTYRVLGGLSRIIEFLTEVYCDA